MGLELAWYKLDETSGTTAIDSSGNGYNGTYYNTITNNQTGKINKAYSLPNTNSYIQLPSGVSVWGDSSYSAFLWYKGTGTAGRLIVKDDSNVNGGLALDIDSSGYAHTHYRGRAGTVINTSSKVNDNIWHHIGVTYDASNGDWKVWVDGSVVGSATANYEVSYSGPVCIGSETSASSEYPCGAYGLYDDVRIYDFALSSSDVALLYNSGNGTDQDLYSLRNPPTPAKHNHFTMSISAEF